MKISRRIRYYLVGFGIGLVACLIIFQGRGCDWLPNERVLNSIRTSSIYYSSIDSCVMAANNITKKDVFLLLENGDVNFGESNTTPTYKTYILNNIEKESECRNYVIEADSLKISFNLFERDSIVFISQFNDINDLKSCSEKSSRAIALYMPNDMTLEKLRSNKFRFEKTFKCEMECYGITELEIDSAMTIGKVLFDKSYPNKKPNPLYYIELKKHDKKTLKEEIYYLMVEQGATKTRFNRITKLSDLTDLDKPFSIEILFNNVTCKCLD